MLRGMLIEARMIHRKVQPWLGLAVVAWLGYLAVLSSGALRTTGLFWVGTEAAAITIAGLLPLAWLTTRNAPHAGHLRHLRPARQVGMSAGGIAAYGCLVLALVAATCFAVCRISERGPANVALVLAEGLLLLVPAAALAPALTGIAPRRAVLLWCTAMATSLLIGIPIPTDSLLTLHRADLSMADIGTQSTGAVLLATMGGLTLSFTLACMRASGTTYAHRHPRRHP